MLSTIREKTQGIIATFIIALIAIPFALWGINSYFEGGSNTSVAEVNGTPIRQPAYQAALEQLRGVNPAQQDNRALREMVLEGLISQTLLVDAAQDRGYRVSDARLAQMIREVPYFQRDGRFDAGLYQALLQRQGMTPQEFETRLRHDNLTTQVQRGLADTAFVTSADTAAVARLLGQERRITYAVIEPGLVAKNVAVTPEEIASHYNEHRDAFQTPEQVRVAYVRLSAASVVKQYQPSDAELRQAYTAEAARYTTPVKRRASHILIAAGATAEDDTKAKTRIAELERQLRGGAEFAKLARSASEDPESAAKGGDLGAVTPGLLPPELERALNDLKVGQVSQPVRTSFGYHLVKLTEYTPEKRTTFEQARPELVEMVRRREGEARFFEQAERLRTIAYEQPESLEPAANALDLTIEQSDWFARSGGAGIAADAKVREAAFQPDQLNGRRNSDTLEMAGDSLLVLRVIDHRPSVQRPLTEVRAEIERHLKAVKTAERTRALAEEWMAKLNQGAELAALARERGVSPRPPQTVTRDTAAGIDRRVVEAAFVAPRPVDGRASYRTVDLGAQGMALVAVTAVHDVEAGKVDAALAQKVRQQLLARRGSDYYGYYRTGLRRDADIQIYRDQL